MSHSILIVEDEIKLATLLADYFTMAEFNPNLIHHGDDVIAWVKKINLQLFCSISCYQVKTASIFAKKLDSFLTYLF